MAPPKRATKPSPLETKTDYILLSIMYFSTSAETAMDFRFAEIDSKIRYKLLSATVAPRPIAWVSTLNEAGRTNAAPFSFFNAFGEDPATVGFSIPV
jgi:hypothetical protein